jgi:orotidine-5'-phosphate decarboxylase
MSYSILKQLESDYKDFLSPLKIYKQELLTIQKSLKGIAGENFLSQWLNAFSSTGSPIVINLDYNASDSKDLDEMIRDSKNKVREMKKIVKTTVGHVSGYKMNEQSMLTFLIAGEPNFVNEAKMIYTDECFLKFHFPIEPILWTDEKLRDIPSTTFQTAKIIYNLGYDAVHCMPQIGPDVAGAAQVAAEEKGGKGVIHVINMTSDGYNYVKKNYFKNGEKTVDLLRRNALGILETEVKISRSEKPKVKIRATGTIEPANRPYELFQSKEKYEGKLAIISIGIGPDQGAWPGSALYAGAHIEGIGRFVYENDNKELDTSENIAKKARACKRSALKALKARFEGKSYPFDDVRDELGEFIFPLNEVTKEGLKLIYEKRKGKSRL